MISIEQFAALTGSTEAELEPHWEKVTALASSMIARLPDIGFLSMQKRIYAFTVIAGEVQEAIYEDEVTMQQAILATAVAKFSDRKFKKSFETYLQAAMMGRIGPEVMNHFTFTLLRG